MSALLLSVYFPVYSPVYFLWYPPPLPCPLLLVRPCQAANQLPRKANRILLGFAPLPVCARLAPALSVAGGASTGKIQIPPSSSPLQWGQDPDNQCPACLISAPCAAAPLHRDIPHRFDRVHQSQSISNAATHLFSGDDGDDFALFHVQASIPYLHPVHSSPFDAPPCGIPRDPATDRVTSPRLYIRRPARSPGGTVQDGQPRQSKSKLKVNCSIFPLIQAVVSLNSIFHPTSPPSTHTHTQTHGRR